MYAFHVEYIFVYFNSTSTLICFWEGEVQKCDFLLKNKKLSKRVKTLENILRNKIKRVSNHLETKFSQLTTNITFMFIYTYIFIILQRITQTFIMCIV